MDSANAVDDEPRNNVQRLNDANGIGDSGGTIPMRTVYVDKIEPNVSWNEARILFKILFRRFTKTLNQFTDY